MIAQCGDTAHFGVDVNNTQPAMINSLNENT